MTKQYKLNAKVGAYNNVSGVTEYESLHLPTVSTGNKILDDGFETIYDYDKYLDPLIPEARNEFTDKVKTKIGESDFNKINEGLRAYIKSAFSESIELSILKASILNAFGKDLLTSKYSVSDDASQQLIKPTYFEKVDKYLEIPLDELISSKSIQYYQTVAVEITKKYYSRYLTELDPPESIEDNIIYGGCRNYMYDKNSRVKNAPDILSVYGGLGDGTLFFMHKLLNSYSINDRVAKHFMVMGANTRLAMLNLELSLVIDDLFSSFIVCEHFVDRQYEFLFLPNRQDIYIYERHASEIMTDFNLTNNLLNDNNSEEYNYWK